MSSNIENTGRGHEPVFVTKHFSLSYPAEYIIKILVGVKSQCHLLL